MNEFGNFFKKMQKATYFITKSFRLGFGFGIIVRIRFRIRVWVYVYVLD